MNGRYVNDGYCVYSACVYNRRRSGWSLQCRYWRRASSSTHQHGAYNQYSDDSNAVQTMVRQPAPKKTLSYRRYRSMNYSYTETSLLGMSLLYSSTVGLGRYSWVGWCHVGWSVRIRLGWADPGGPGSWGKGGSRELYHGLTKPEKRVGVLVML